MSKAPDTVGEIMTRDVVTVTPDDTVETAVRVMIDHEIGSVVVVEKDAPLGLFTERDLTRKILETPDLLHLRVGDVMSSPVVSTEPGVEIVEAFDLMTSKNIRRLPVVEGGGLVGIVTERDLIKWVSAVAQE